jgi:aminopeptidase N
VSDNNLLRDEAQRRAALLSVDSYTVSLDLTTGDKTFVSTSVVRFACSEPGAATFLELSAPAVREIVLNGEPVPSEAFDGNRIAISGLAADNELRVVADCAYVNTGEGLHRFVDPVDEEVYLYSQFETYDAHRVYACFDQPDLKASFAFDIVAPAHWQVVTNMAAVGEPAESGDAKHWRFPRSPRMSTYITAVVAGPYHVVRDKHGDIDLGVYCRTSLAQYLDADEIFTVTKQGFDYFHEAFDYPYAFGKYDQLFVPEFNAGAMENAGAVTFLEDYVFRSKVTGFAYERRAETILHEMAHMWFGDLVTMRWWDDLWLNESFATYASVLAQSSATKFTHAWTTFANVEKTWAYRQDQLPSTHPIVAEIADIAAVEVNFDGITYAKGASVLKQLVAWVGEDAFMAGLRAYFRRHEYGNTELRDLLARWRRRPAATCRPGPRSGWRRPGSTRCARRSTPTPPARSRPSASSRRRRATGRRCARTGWPSVCTTRPTPDSSAAAASSSTWSAPRRRCRSCSANGSPTSCWSTTTT